LAETVAGVASFVTKKFGLGEVSKQYLNEKFGWENTISDIKDLLTKSEQISKQINYLLSRQDKPTTFRVKKTFLESLDSPPGFTYFGMPYETNPSTNTLGTRKVELKVVVNAKVKFPFVRPPVLRGGQHIDGNAYARTELENQIGGYLLKPNDIYRLVPWTWLVDWFVDASSYLDCIEAINGDDSIINYGFATYNSSLHIVSKYQAEVPVFEFDSFDGAASFRFLNQPVDHSSVVDISYQKRKDLATVNDVKVSWDLGNFSGYQASILAALLFAKHQ